MTSIDTLFGHIEDLTRINVDNILQDMITYGNSLNVTGETVIIKFKSFGNDIQFENGLGCFLVNPQNMTYIKDNVVYSNLKSGESLLASNLCQSNGNYYTSVATSGYDDIQFQLNNVAEGNYYLYIGDYDTNNNNEPYLGENTYPISSFCDRVKTAENGEVVSGQQSRLDEENNIVSIYPITVSSSSDNTWYVDGYY